MKSLFAAAGFCACAFLLQPSARAQSPTDGWSRYADTFFVQKPWDLPPSDRFSDTGGMYTCSVKSNDKTHYQGGGTGPRTEMRWTTWHNQDVGHMWEADVMMEPGSNKTCIFQMKSNTAGEAIYLQMGQSGELHSGGGGKSYLTNYAGKWFNLKIEYERGAGKVWIDNVLQFTSNHGGGTHDWYFKNGTYNNGMASGTTSTVHFKNMKFWLHEAGKPPAPPMDSVPGNWSPASEIPGQRITCFAGSGDALFAGTQSDGVYLSTDHASSWTRVNTGLASLKISSLAASNNMIFAATHDKGIFVSSNRGGSWAPANTGLPTLYANVVAACNGTLYFGAGDGGVTVSKNNGGSWGGTQLQIHTLTAFANIGENVFAGTFGAGMFVSANGGGWKSINTGLASTNISCLAASGASIFAGTFGGGGLLVSKNNGASWTEVKTGLSSDTLVTALAASKNIVFEGTLNGGVLMSSDGGASWVNLGLKNAGVRALIADDGYVYAAGQGTVWRRLLSSAGSIGDHSRSVRRSSERADFYTLTGRYFGNLDKTVLQPAKRLFILK